MSIYKGFLSLVSVVLFFNQMSCSKVLNRIYKLKNEIAIFLSEEGHKHAEEFYKLFLMKLAYLVDVFEKLNLLNLQLQQNKNRVME